MNWITIIWPMVPAACITLALVHLRIAFGDGRRAPHLFFSLAAVAVAVISGLELTLLCTTDLARYDVVLRWATVPIAIMVCSVVAFVWVFFGTGRNWLGVAAVTTIFLAELANRVASARVRDDISAAAVGFAPDYGSKDDHQIRSHIFGRACAGSTSPGSLASAA